MNFNFELKKIDKTHKFLKHKLKDFKPEEAPGIKKMLNKLLMKISGIDFRQSVFCKDAFKKQVQRARVINNQLLNNIIFKERAVI